MMMMMHDILLAAGVLLLLLTSSVHAVFHSSVWCHGSHQDHRHCSFNNLCYSSHYKQYLFFHSQNESVISGVEAPSEQIQLAKLSSVEGHDHSYLEYVMLPANRASHRFNIQHINEPTLLARRYKPGKFHHVIHDDLLPIFSTMNYICYGNAKECLSSHNIAFDDDHSEKQFDVLYNSLSTKIMYLQEHQEEEEADHLVCFVKAIIGLETDTVWYIHGKGPKDVPNLKPSYLEEFRQYLLDNLPWSRSQNTDAMMLKSEQIMNPNHLYSTMEQQVSNMVQFDIEQVQDNVVDMIRYASQTKLLVGHHHSFMCLSLFLPSDSAVIELFPYGLDEESSSFIKVLAATRKLVYHSWINHAKENSFGDSRLLQHLDPEVQEAILSMDYVGSVQCCDDPAYLYRLGQKTIVDITTFGQTMKATLEDCLQQSKSESPETDVDEWLLPSAVYAATCTLKNGKGEENLLVNVEWKEPLNLQYIPHTSITYEIMAEAQPIDTSQGTDFVGEYSTNRPQISFSTGSVNLRKHKRLHIWIGVLLDYDLRSTDTLVDCDLDQDIQI